MTRVLLVYCCTAFSLFFLTRYAGRTMAAGLEETEKSAQGIGNNIAQLFRDVTRFNDIKKKYVESELETEDRNGPAVVQKMKKHLEAVLQSKIDTVLTLAEGAEDTRVNFTYEKGIDKFQFYNSKYLEGESYLELKKVPSFADKQVNFTYSTVHIPTDVYNGSETILNSVKWSKALNTYFRKNREKTPTLLWQLLGTSTGVYRFHPGYKWTNANDNDFFDHRRRGWYIQGSSSPKDMVILLDLSGSMVGNKLAIVKLAANILLETLQENDFVNIVTFNKGSRMLCEEETVQKNSRAARAKPCITDSLIQATIQNKKYLKEMVAHVQASEVAEVSEGFKKSIELLKSTRTSNRSSTNCLRTINFFTDGVENNERDKTIKVLDEYGAKKERIRVFGYLVGREKGSPFKPVQEFACSTQGYFYTIETLSDVRENVSPYLSVLGRPQGFKDKEHHHPVSWTPIYLDGGGLGLMITVVTPVYDGKQKDKLLGVVGTDVALPQLNGSVPAANIGVNGYGFTINNNGFILFHPLLKGGEDPPNLVLADVNLEEYKYNLGNLSRKLIDRETGSKTFSLRILSKDMKRISPKRLYSFYYTDIVNTSFSSAVAISEHGKKKLRPKAEQTVDKDTKKLFEGKDGEILMVAPWRICEKIVSSDRNTTPLYIPTHADAKDMAEKLTSADLCNKELLSALLYDAKALKDISWNIQENDTRGYFSAFVGTSGGLTKVYAPGQESPVSRDVGRESYFSRAADFMDERVIVSAPYKAPGSQNDNDTVVTLSSSIFIQDALAAVVGMQMKDDVLKELIFNNSESCKDNGDEWNCYLIDEDGFVVATSKNDSSLEVGKHFGAVHGGVMEKMLNESIFTKFSFNDTQSKCKKPSGANSNAMRLINPFLAVTSYVTWMTQTLFWTLVQFNIFSFFTGKSQVKASEKGTMEFCTMNIPFFKVNKSRINTKDNLDGICDESCVPPFNIAPVKDTNLFMIMVKNCGCEERRFRTVPEQVESVPFIAPNERYRRLPHLKCYAFNKDETRDCGTGANLTPMKLLVTLLMTAYILLVQC